MSQASRKQETKSAEEIRRFYDSVYHAEGSTHGPASQRHFNSLANRVGIRDTHFVLDVACGSGEWLLSCAQRGAKTAGVDISEAAIARCRRRLPRGDFRVHAAEMLPFPDDSFDVVSCLGALEHFLDPYAALCEMIRVAKPRAHFLLLVPNAGFLTRRLGLFGGTCQTDAKEEVRTLEEWKRLFHSAGLEVSSMWRDLHILSKDWILNARWPMVPFRFLQAAALPVWPLRWQYQVYFLCMENPGR